MKNHSTQRATMLGKTASYINRHHLALFVLFFALGGTSFAAGKALLPGNSVGTKQVINGSLQTRESCNDKARSTANERGRAHDPAPPRWTPKPATRARARNRSESRKLRQVPVGNKAPRLSRLYGGWTSWNGDLCSSCR